MNISIYLRTFFYFFSKKTQPENMEEKKALPRPILQRPPSHESLRVLRDSVSESDEHNQGDLPPLVEEHMDEPANTSGATNSYSTKEGRCIECVKAIPVFSPGEIEAGDHVVSSGAVYDHHGIIISKLDDGETFEILEATNTVSGAVLGISKLFGGKAKIQTSFKKLDFEREKICVIEYGNRRFSKKETIQRALNFYNNKEESGNYKYDLFDNNCEHFATFCVTGQNFSVQVTKFRLTWKLFWSSGFVGISNELERNEKEYENNIICGECYEMNKKLLGVRVKPIEAEGDVEKGDIIRYSYWNLWHEAVVLEKPKVVKNTLVCSIAHYAFCGPFNHRTIREEILNIRLAGQCSKVDYSMPQYDVYKPEEVVQRARRRMGEQRFVFFSNDSSHFARWCKLRLKRSYSSMV